MLNLSRIQSELERAKEKLRNVEEIIQKVEGKAFSNGPIRPLDSSLFQYLRKKTDSFEELAELNVSYGGLKSDYHSNKIRNPAAPEDAKNQRRRIITSTVDSRIQRVPVDDSSFGVKRGLREKREPALGLKRQSGDNRPQGVFARLSGAPFHQADEEDEDDFGKKPTLPSRVFTTAAEVPSRQEVIAAQAQDEQSKERNKRMFGALVGTLQKFRKEETRVREREEKRLKVEKKLEENAKREKEKLMQEKRELFMEKKRREVEIKRIEWSLNRVKEYEAWEANVIPLKNFIHTQAKPHIFYLPSIHNAKTEERLAQSQKLVEKMIEKRKNNLKEEIENSEKKARKAAAEGAEEEEAENIPEDNDESCNAEQQMQIDFEPKNKENGYFDEVKKDKASSPKDLENANASKMEEEENWDGQETESKKPTEALEELDSSSKQEGKEESVVTVSKDWNNELSSSLGVRSNDEGPLDESGGGDEEENPGGRETREIEKESAGMDAEEGIQESSKAKVESLSGETEKVTEEEAEPDKAKSNSEETTAKSDTNTEDNLKKKVESQDEKSKSEESSKKEKSPGRKSRKRSRSPRKSWSPKDSSRSKHRESSSRQRRVSRTLSSSSSPPKKSRVSASKRGQKSSEPRKRSPPSKAGRRRRSSSQSSGSVSPKKKRCRSSSSSRSSNSD